MASNLRGSNIQRNYSFDSNNLNMYNQERCFSSHIRNNKMLKKGKNNLVYEFEKSSSTEFQHEIVRTFLNLC